MHPQSSRSMLISWGIPGFLVLFASLLLYSVLSRGIGRNKQSVEKLNARIDTLNERIDGIEGRLKTSADGGVDTNQLANSSHQSPDWELAERLQKGGKFDEAKRTWTDLLQKLHKDDPKAAQVRAFISECQANDRGGEVRPVPVESPGVIPEQSLADHYPVGKIVRSHAVLRVQGRGENKKWGFKSEAQFRYLANALTETEVLESAPKAGVIKFRHRFLTISQVLVVTDHSIEWSLDDLSPAASLATTFADGLLENHPVYPKLKAGAMLLKEADPRLKGTLTYIAKSIGLDPAKSALPEGAEVHTKLSKLNGCVVDLTYVSGFGVSGISQHGGEKTLSNEDLVQIANSLSLTLDYHIFPIADRKPGDRWTVRAADVGGLLALDGLDLQVEGSMEVQREPSADPKTIPLKILSGNWDLRSNDQGKRDSARAQIRSGHAAFAPTDKILERCDVKFDMKSLWQGEESLLFQTKAVRDLQVDSTYRAERRPAPIPGAGHE